MTATPPPWQSDLEGMRNLLSKTPRMLALSEGPVSGVLTTKDFKMELIIIALLGAAYLLPSLVAWRRNHRNAFPIFLVNVFTGWMILPWFIALVWAFMV